MQIHPTCDKGDIGVLKIMTDLSEQGLQVFIPVSAAAPFDLVVYDGEQFYKVQAKYRTKSKTGVLNLDCRRSVINRNTVRYRSYSNSEVDIIAVYSPDTDQCYYIKFDELNTRYLYLRIDEPKNSQNIGIKMASDYRKWPHSSMAEHAADNRET